MRSFSIFLTFLFLFSCSQNEKDRRETSPHFKEGVFHNEASIPNWSFLDVFKMRFFSEKWSKWPSHVPLERSSDPKPFVKGARLRVTVIGHATVLLQSNGYNILTDPIFSDRCSPVSFLGPKRVSPPAIQLDRLPKIDLILISHDHYDHLDLPSVQKIVERDQPKILVGLGVKAHIPEKEFVEELDWWESFKFSKDLKVTFAPTQHFSGRWLHDRMTTLWGAYVIELPGYKIYFGGDSGYGLHYKKTYEKFGPMDLALLPIGAYKPRYFMKFAHMNPEEAVQAHKDLRSKRSVGIHYGTFQLTAEPVSEPLEALKAAKKKHELPNSDFLTLPFGKSLEF